MESKNDKTELCLTRRETLQGMAGLVAVSLVGGSTAAAELDLPPVSDRDLKFNSGWRFYRGEAPGAEAPTFDDAAWHALDIPHDWSIEDRPGEPAGGEESIWTGGADPVRVGPFDLYSSEGQISTGWTVGGIGWYRKTFPAPRVPASGKVEIRFEGVYMNADVWLNGLHLGNHPYGYTGFSFDITRALKQGSNVLAVRVNNTGRNSRWYSGSGIFRNAWLNVTGEVRIPGNGIWITTVDASKSGATVRVETTVENGASATRRVNIRVALFDGNGSPAAEGRATADVAAGTRSAAWCDIKVASPRLWSPNDPQLYRAEVVVEADRKPADAASVSFGIRKVEIDASQGLRINGEGYKMRGGCVHHDNGPLGSACIPRAEERRVEILKANGFNAIRTSHNPPSSAFLDACDRLGMMVIDEAFDCWESGNKNPDDYHLYFKEWWQRDLESMILRDRNHPSVILWSIGNEINERADPAGVEIGKALSAYAKKLDPTRLVTAAICHPWDHPNQAWKDMQPAFTYLDVGGYNYQWREYGPDHASYPQRVMAGTESFPNEAYENWRAVDSSPWILGDFVWTAIDYLGESGIGHASISTAPGPDPVFSPPYPWFNSYCGDIDLIGDKKPQSWFRDVVWGRSKVEMAVQRPLPPRYHERISRWGWSDELRSWTWEGFEGARLLVRVYTSGDRVQLLLNGQPAGEQQLTEKNALTAEFTVPYSPGELKAVAYKNGAQIGAITLTTTGKTTALVLTPDRTRLRASRDDLSYVTVRVVDDAGRVVPDAAIPVSFSIEGDGEIAAVANADPKTVASFRLPRHSTFHGACLVVLRPSGRKGSIKLVATAQGLAGGSALVEVS